MELLATPTPLQIFLQGFGICAGLIIAIGAQNSFVLLQGLKRDRIFIVATTCSLLDAFFILLGVSGVGVVIAKAPVLQRYIFIVGCIFVLFYGLRSLKSAFSSNKIALRLSNEESDKKHTPLKKLLFLCAGFSVLNPHMYIDTFILLGGTAAKYNSNGRVLFALGAITASFIWFYLLGFGAAQLAPVFKKRIAWRVLDLVIAGMMFVISFSLAKSFL